MEVNSILFVCLGNICRSPLAEAIAREYIKKNNLNIKIDSAGTGSWHVGENPCENSQKIAKLHNIDISQYKARQVTKKDFINFDIIVALDDKNIYDLHNMGCENLSKLGFYGADNQDVPDPYFFNGFEGFEKVYDMIEKCVKTLIDSK